MNCFALQGCRVTLSVPETRIYYQQYPGSQNNPVRYFTGSDYYNENCPANAGYSTTHPGNISNTTIPGTVCWTDFIGPGTNPNNAGNYRYNGFLVTYDFVPCPIDNYMPCLLVVMGGLGVITIKRWNFYVK
ncbi:hypothetical protein [Pedobacter aquatilis]|uniref:hypothetical protein n=1 Tax=Pedobacter aquatilis TaxID=351343 RepID=UPI00292F2B90|nr:hypothetical protein [Pedobacter aquatilis]